ncbi:MAG: methylated-DNA--[protein]-cysteine S-methyltransferase [Nitrosospira sp.]|nr:methylated-DNA--[protein]-cysteine S-methyltransferase [Nitrosospira sp.]
MQYTLSGENTPECRLNLVECRHDQTEGCPKVKAADDYQAKLATPFAVLGLRIEEDWLTHIEYLPLDTPPLTPQTPLAEEVCNQLQAYLADPGFVFDLSLHIAGTVHQRRVWDAIQGIQSGKTRSYADIAVELHSAPRAVGQACGANRLPIVIPCHRVIAKNGGLGGFMSASDGVPLTVKRWLLRHERV